MAREAIDDLGFIRLARELLINTPELAHVGYMDNERFARWSISNENLILPELHPADELVEEAESYWAFIAARDSARPIFSRPYIGPNNEVFLELHAPVINSRGHFLGTVYGAFPVASLLDEALPKEFQGRYLISIIDGGGNPVASNGSRNLERAVEAYEVPLDPPGQGLKLRAIALQSSTQLIQSMLTWTVAGLSVVIVWSFFMLMRHGRARTKAENQLYAEAEFRRAIENSVSTGLCVFDLQGKITYSNPGLTKMTGYSENILKGTSPPFPFWPDNQSTEHKRNLEMMLSGMAPDNGIEQKMIRKDGSQFEARLYVSPLIDAKGEQSGWMTSITDITEPKRIREELAAAQERFITVLEALDAAISVSTPAENGVCDLLFANSYYRLWFSDTSDGAFGLNSIIQTTAPGVFECFWKENQSWFEVRRRTISWVDGRLVYMDVTTNITERKLAAENAKIHQEKLQFTSRLVTMGEMASLLAHELNQPLAAISNYSTGSISRLKNGRCSPEDLLPILEKTTQQAQRAGNVIRRIREFVKRKAPQRKSAALHKIIEDAVVFAEIDAKNREIEIIVEKPSENIPEVFADQILIEQVLLNLIKNGMDAMVNTPSNYRRITVQIEQSGKNLILKVSDHGSGIPEAIRGKLFEPFFSTKSEGMGMGLNICRSVVEYHDSRLEIENNWPMGTRFAFALPIYQEQIHQPLEEDNHDVTH
jgi:PAS domain S-box-containing protein